MAFNFGDLVRRQQPQVDAQGRTIAPGQSQSAVLGDLRTSAERVYNPQNDPNYARLAEAGQTRSAQELAYAEAGASRNEIANQRQAQAVGFMQDQYNTFTAERDYTGARQALYANATDELSQGTLGGMDALGAHFAQSGQAASLGMASLASDIQAQQQMGVHTAQNNLEQWQTNMETQDLVKNWGASQTMAGAMAQEDSDIWQKTVAELLGSSLSREDSERGVMMQREANDAMKDAAEQDFWGSIASGGIGLAGSFLTGGLF